jgi:hypothetical protein
VVVVNTNNLPGRTPRFYLAVPPFLPDREKIRQELTKET